MLAVNAKVTFRTNGRGVTRVWKGVIKQIVKANTVPASEAVRACVPHGNKKSNRDRYIVLLDETGTLMWANIKTTVAASKQLPEHKPRLAKKKKMNPVTKPKRKGGKNKKTTWYSMVDGKIVSQRKVICPEGYFRKKPANGDMYRLTHAVINGNVVSIQPPASN